jgi:predicted TIM-barrel fold metal-dependent hydrolase
MKPGTLMPQRLGRPVFDFHARLVKRPGAVGQLLATMDAAGIDRAAVSAGGLVDLDRLSRQIVEGGQVHHDADNAAVLAGCDSSGGRLLPVYFGNPHDTTDSYRRQAGRFRGLEISPAVHGVGFADARVAALVRVAAAAGHHVYSVCVVAPGAGTADFVALAARFPEVTFVFGHCGFIGIDIHAINEIAPQPNILAETSGCFGAVARFAVDRLGPDRVLFGTEYPLQHPTVELAKFAALELSEPVWRQVAWRNAHRLFAEETP